MSCRLFAKRTVAWNPRERHVKVDGEFFSSAPVHDNRSIRSYSTVVDELHGGECKYNCSREDGHLAVNRMVRPDEEVKSREGLTEGASPSFNFYIVRRLRGA